jgi:predicted DsbA family dithiol-disulfide isomerase
LGLNLDLFAQDLKSEASRQRIFRDTLEARECGGKETPLFFLNGAAIEPSAIYSRLRLNEVLLP